MEVAAAVAFFYFCGRRRDASGFFSLLVAIATVAIAYSVWMERRSKPDLELEVSIQCTTNNSSNTQHEKKPM